jgi:hypothetical protein
MIDYFFELPNDLILIYYTLSWRICRAQDDW